MENVYERKRDDLFFTGSAGGTTEGQIKTKANTRESLFYKRPAVAKWPVDSIKETFF